MSQLTNKKSLSGHQIADLTVLLVLILFTTWYLLDTYSASTHIMNLILVMPLGGLIIVLCCVEFIKQLLKPTPPVDDLEPVASVLPVMVMLAAYVLSLPWLGFDVGTFLFVAVFLWFNGERRIHWLLVYSLVFASATALFFSKMLPYPMPMLLLPTLY